MASDDELRRIFREARTIAVVGASMHDLKPSHFVPHHLQEQGYRIVPVNPRGGEIFGEKVYRRLEDVDVPFDVVEVFRPPARRKPSPAAPWPAGPRCCGSSSRRTRTRQSASRKRRGSPWSSTTARCRSTAGWSARPEGLRPRIGTELVPSVASHPVRNHFDG